MNSNFGGKFADRGIEKTVGSDGPEPTARVGRSHTESNAAQKPRGGTRISTGAAIFSSALPLEYLPFMEPVPLVTFQLGIVPIGNMIFLYGSASTLYGR
jgi:hypothetical protein